MKKKTSDFQHVTLHKGFSLRTRTMNKFKKVLARLMIKINLDNRVSKLAMIASILGLGTENLPTQRHINMELEKMYGASLDIDVIKRGESAYLQLIMVFPGDSFIPSKESLLEKVLHFLSEILVNPLMEKGTFKKEYFELAKINLANDILGIMNDKQEYAVKKAVRIMCKGEPFAIDRYGTLEELKKVTVKNLTKFHKELIETAPMELYLIGNFNSKKANRIAKEAFNFKRSKIEKLNKVAIRKTNKRKQEVIETQQVAQGNLVVGFRLIPELSRIEKFAALVMDGIFGKYSHSKLFSVVREKEGLAYSIHSHLEMTKQLLLVTAGIDENKFSKTVALIYEQLNEIKKGNIDPKEFNFTKKTIINSLSAIMDSVMGLTSLDMEARTTNLCSRPADFAKEVRAVSIKDVIKVANKVKPELVYLLKNENKKN